MGEKRRKTLADTAIAMQYPNCCYCGNPTETADHFPPKIFFRNNLTPTESIRPSCYKCNQGWKYDDLGIGALFARDALDFTPEGTKRRQQKMKRISRQWHELYNEIKVPAPPSSNGGHNVYDALRAAGVHVAQAGPVTQELVRRTAIRATKALFFHHATRRFAGQLHYDLIPTLQAGPGFFEQLVSTLPETQTSRRERVGFSDQFSYRYLVAEEGGATFCAVVHFGGQWAYNLVAFDTASASQHIQNLPDAAKDWEWIEVS